MKRGLFLLSIIIILISSIILVTAQVDITPSSFTKNINVTSTYTITINNANPGQNANITQVNFTLPNSIIFIKNTNGTDAFGEFTNISKVLSWTNSSYYLINGSEKRSFWFNANATVQGVYNITVTYVNGTGAFSENISVTIGDIEEPIISFVSPTPSDGATLTYNYIQSNVTASDNVEISVITIYLHNSSFLINSITSSSSPFFYNFTELSEGTYYLNATVNDTSKNNASTETRIITISFSSEVQTLSIYYGSLTPGDGSELPWDYIFVEIIPNNESLVKNITIYLYNSTGLLDSATLSNPPFSKNFTNLENGMYKINATAFDIFENRISLETRTIEIKAQIICVPNWDCTEWMPKECPKNETQTRICTDLNNCNNFSNKPSEKRTCEYKGGASLAFFLVVGIIAAIIIGVIILLIHLKRKAEEETFSSQSTTFSTYRRTPPTSPTQQGNIEYKGYRRYP